MSPAKTRPHQPVLAEWTSEISPSAEGMLISVPASSQPPDDVLMCEAAAALAEVTTLTENRQQFCSALIATKLDLPFCQSLLPLCSPAIAQASCSYKETTSSGMY